MNRKPIITLATVAALGAGGAGAIAATSDHQAAESAVLADAAEQLGVSSSDLRSALSKAEDAQLAAQVKAGTLTQAQADEIRQHRQQDGMVLGLGPSCTRSSRTGRPSSRSPRPTTRRSPTSRRPSPRARPRGWTPT